jgi:hypothetical protein
VSSLSSTTPRTSLRRLTSEERSPGAFVSTQRITSTTTRESLRAA